MGNRELPGEVLTALPRPVLIDLDGTLYTDAGPVTGAVVAVADLRRRQVPFRLVTNTTGKSRRQIAERLRGYGFTVGVEEIVSALVAATAVLRSLGALRVAPFTPAAGLEDLADFALVGGVTGRPAVDRPDAVLIGDLGSEWSHALLNEAFRYVLEGALLVAIEKDRYWLAKDGLELDAGPYVAALEYATGVTATVCGKPSAAFYHAALASMNISVEGSREQGGGSGGAAPRTAPHSGLQAPAVMVGDDLWSDVQGAQRAGLQGWLVRTGKFRADVLDRSGVEPDRILDSIADILTTA